MTESASPPARAADLLRQTLPARLRAAGIHLTISAVIFAVALYLILVHWFPGFHFDVDGGWRGVRIMAGVDLVLGPALTLVIFNPFKARKLIAFDLTCIGITQFAALVWGFYAIHSQRPVVVSFYQGSFVSANEEPLKAEKYDLAALEQLSDRKPALLFTTEPATEEELANAQLQELLGGVPLSANPLFFRRLDQNWDKVRTHAVDPARRSKQSREFAAELPDFLAAHDAHAGDLLFFPYEGREGTCTLAFTPSGALVGALGCSSY